MRRFLKFLFLVLLGLIILIPLPVVAQDATSYNHIIYSYNCSQIVDEAPSAILQCPNSSSVTEFYYDDYTAKQGDTYHFLVPAYNTVYPSSLVQLVRDRDSSVVTAIDFGTPIYSLDYIPDLQVVSVTWSTPGGGGAGTAPTPGSCLNITDQTPGIFTVLANKFPLDIILGTDSIAFTPDTECPTVTFYTQTFQICSILQIAQIAKYAILLGSVISFVKSI